MIRRVWTRTRAAATVLLILALLLLASLAMGAALDDAAPAATGRDTVTTVHDDRPAALPGDDNGDRVIDEDESGWDCATMGNRDCGPAGTPPADIVLPADCTGPNGCAVSGLPPECRNAGNATLLCVTVASRPAYGWTNADGSRADNPNGRAMVNDLDEQPGTPAFAKALAALDDEWREHH